MKKLSEGFLRDFFEMGSSAPKPDVCPFCGSMPHKHVGLCPQVRAVEYHPDGTIKRVEKR